MRPKAPKSEMLVNFLPPFGLLLGVPGASLRHQISKKAVPEPMFGDFFADPKKRAKKDLSRGGLGRSE